MLLTIERIVGDRELILGLDALYRDVMKAFEVERLLPAAETVAAKLDLDAPEIPLEGYYGESPELTRYFRLMRGLQTVPDSARPQVESLEHFQLLRAVTQSPIYGIPSDAPLLFPPARDALYYALASLPPEVWNRESLTHAAAKEAENRNDCSLVGLACRARDSVCIAALRESVVLYADVFCLMASRTARYTYVWNVTPAIAAAANRFIAELNALASVKLPEASKTNASTYFHAAQSNYIAGRCVRIGTDDRTHPPRYYHWAVGGDVGEYTAEDFWSDAIWTTERYRKEGRRLKR